ncbi:MAG: hypothetical protein M3Q29_22585 [Chloroflexota bacterium]|nr:hypothetical protein [Chloroflexota bacterium]
MSAGSIHVPFEQLADLVEGRLSPEARMLAQSHVSGCAACGAEARWLEHTITLMREDSSEDAPAYVVARATRMFRPRVAAERPSIVRRLVAALRFDSAQQPLAFGVRFVLPPPRQRLYRVDDYDVDIRIAPEGSGHVVSGQVLGPINGGSVYLWDAMDTVQTELNALEEFVLPAVSPGCYTLRIDCGEVSVQIPDLDVGL